jgi:hypothetical protein
VGANSIGLRVQKRGRYRLALTAVNGEQRAEETATLRVTRRR